tara:strand:- start:281 stop:454 length:174 start_codon:yes stop_codon:yes gene_type:complete
VKANINGVNITPPPTPAITDMIATQKLNKKDMNMMSTPVNPKSPSNAAEATNISRNM